MKVCYCSFFWSCDYSQGPWMSFVTTDGFSVKIRKSTSRISVSWSHSLHFRFLSIFWVAKMTILSKVRKLDTFESHNSWKLSFSNIRDFRSNRNICQSLLESYSPNILALSETNSEDSVDSSNFSVRGYIPLIQNDSVTHMYGLGVYLNQGLLFMDSYLCFWLV